jgi:hypothetical protein
MVMITKPKGPACVTCGTIFRLNPGSFPSSEGQKFELSLTLFPVSGPTGKYNRLITALQSFWRASLEGKLYSADYDGYCNQVSYSRETDQYQFRLKIVDSHEGNSWWSGKFSIKMEMGIPNLEVYESVFVRC